MSSRFVFIRSNALTAAKVLLRKRFFSRESRFFFIAITPPVIPGLTRDPGNFSLLNSALEACLPYFLKFLSATKFPFLSLYFQNRHPSVSFFRIACPCPACPSAGWDPVVVVKISLPPPSYFIIPRYAARLSNWGRLHQLPSPGRSTLYVRCPTSTPNPQPLPVPRMPARDFSPKI